MGKKRKNVTDTVVASVVASVASIAGQPGDVVTFSATAKNAAGQVLSGKVYTAVSASPGVVQVTSVVGNTVTCTILAVTGGVNVTATCETVSATPVAVSATWVLASLTLTPTSAAIQEGATTTFTATAKNRNGLTMPLPSLEGSTSNSSVATVSGISGSTVTVVGIIAGSATIRVFSGTVLSNAIPITVSAIPSGGSGGGGSSPTPTSYRVTAPAAQVPAGSTVLITAELLDENGAALALAGRTVTWSKTGLGGSFSSGTSVTNAVGIATVTLTVATDATVDHTVTATESGGVTGTSDVIGIIANTPTRYAVSVINISPAATSTIAVTAQLTDVYSNPVTLAGQVVTWSKTGAGGSFSAATSTTNGSGVATVNFTVGAAGVSHVVTATDGASRTGSSPTISVPSGAGSFDEDAELPRLTVNTSAFPTVNGSTINVANGSDLQAAINAAVLLDPTKVHEIVLAQGATFITSVGFVLPTHGSQYIIIRTASGGLPAFGTRARPSTSGPLAKIITNTAGPAFYTASGASHWWLANLEITATPQGGGIDYNFGLIVLGQPGDPTSPQPGDETTLGSQAHHTIVDRCYIHGSSSVSVRNGVIINGQYQAVIECWIDDIHWPGTESHGVVGWAGAGPFKVSNNHLQVASIGFLYGGAFTTIPLLTPADFEITRNHCYKPPSWQGIGWNIKNHIEIKHGSRALIEGNVCDGCWAGDSDQNGHSMMFYPGGDGDMQLYTVHTDDITIRKNIIRNVPIGIEVAAWPYQTGVAASRYSLHDNLLYNIGPYGPLDSSARIFQISDNFTKLCVKNNTGVKVRNDLGGPFRIALSDPGGSTVPFASLVRILNNIVGCASPNGSFYGEGGSGTSVLNLWAGLTGWTVQGNVFWEDAVAPPDGRAPDSGNNTWLANLAAVQLDTDYSLKGTSPVLTAGVGGTRPGADITAVLAATAGVVVAP